MRSMKNRALLALIVTLLVGFGLVIDTNIALAQETAKCEGEDCDCYATGAHVDYLQKQIDALGAKQDTKASKQGKHGLSWRQYQRTPWAGLHGGVGFDLSGNFNLYGNSGDFVVPLRLAAFFRAIEPTSHLGLELKWLVGGQFTNDRYDGDTVFPFNTALRVSAMGVGKHWALKFGPEVMFSQGSNVGTSDDLTTLLYLGGEYRVNHFYVGLNLAWSVYSERGAYDGAWIGLEFGYTSQKEDVD